MMRLDYYNKLCRGLALGALTLSLLAVGVYHGDVIGAGGNAGGNSGGNGGTSDSKGGNAPDADKANQDPKSDADQINSLESEAKSRSYEKWLADLLEE